MPVVLTIALAAFLTFQVEFILARALLPAFGGTPAVWTTALLFFQVALLAGYAWSFWLARQPVRRQLRLHGALAAVALLALLATLLHSPAPLLPGADVRAAAGASPALEVCRVLAVCCGLPFALLAATSPLVQAWVARAPQGQRPVLRLYAVSNLGSLLGLLSYPFLFEPYFDLRTQAWAWTALFAAFLGSLAITARRILREPSRAEETGPPPRDLAPLPPAAAADVALWILLPAAGSALMLSVSNAICQDVAVVPLLWVAPLAVYLVTYILPFRSLRWAPRHVSAFVAAVGCAAALFAILWADSVGAYGYIAVQLALLGGLGLLLHGETARLAPAGPRLPGYYLALAAGGALGGAFVSLAAPVWFSGYWELPATLLAAWLIVLAAWWRDRGSPLRAGGWFGPVVLCGLAGTVAGAWLASGATPEARLREIAAGTVVGLALGGFLGGLVRPLRHGAITGLAVAALLLLVESLMVAQISRGARRLLARERNFFGVVKVVANGKPGTVAERNELVHGWISHGLQFRDPILRKLPTAYYTHSSGAARAIALARERRPGRPLRLGAVGLGAGTIAALTRPGDRLRFYEINPAVIRFARGPDPLFTFLADAPGTIEVAEGDGRQELLRELGAGRPGQFDVLLLDAFSSDAVPSHLLTVEAFELYRRHAAPDGALIAVHITNRYLDLEPLLFATARHFGWGVMRVQGNGDAPLPFPSDWMILATAPGLLPAGGATRDAGAGPLPAPWTDRFSSLLPLFR